MHGGKTKQNIESNVHKYAMNSEFDAIVLNTHFFVLFCSPAAVTHSQKPTQEHRHTQSGITAGLV